MTSLFIPYFGSLRYQDPFARRYDDRYTIILFCNDLSNRLVSMVSNVYTKIKSSYLFHYVNRHKIYIPITYAFTRSVIYNLSPCQIRNLRYSFDSNLNFYHRYNSLSAFNSYFTNCFWSSFHPFSVYIDACNLTKLITNNTPKLESSKIGCIIGNVLISFNACLLALCLGSIIMELYNSYKENQQTLNENNTKNNLTLYSVSRRIDMLEAQIIEMNKFNINLSTTIQLLSHKLNLLEPNYLIHLHNPSNENITNINYEKDNQEEKDNRDEKNNQEEKDNQDEKVNQEQHNDFSDYENL